MSFDERDVLFFCLCNRFKRGDASAERVTRDFLQEPLLDIGIRKHLAMVFMQVYSPGDLPYGVSTSILVVVSSFQLGG